MSAVHPEQTLEKIRREIDDIDERLLDLLLQRAEATARVRSTKSAAGTMRSSPFRPAREAQMLRRLVARAGERFDHEALVRLWRVILSASVQSQAAVSIHVDQSIVGDVEARLLIASHFCGMDVVSHVDPAAAIQTLKERKLDLAVVRTESAWVESLDIEGDDRPAIIGALPALADATSSNLLVIGYVASQPSGDDHTILLSNRSLPDGGLSPIAREVRIGNRIASLVPGFHLESDEAIFAINEANPDLDLRVAGHIPASLKVSP